MRTLLSLVVIVFAVALSACAERSVEPPHDDIRAVVEVIDGKGHGSGVHIGNGYVVTAAHVVGDNKSMTLKSPDGGTQEAEVLWRNKTYDVALMRAADPDKLGTAHLACRTPKAGELISAKGNPLNIEFVTVWGRVAGDARAGVGYAVPGSIVCALMGRVA